MHTIFDRLSVAEHNGTLSNRATVKSDSDFPVHDGFQQSILRQIAINRARTPNERFLAMCDLLDAARAMAPMDEASRQRRLRAKAARELEKEKWRAEYRRLASRGYVDPAGV